jgi:4'-phosphopantetheinyl transferase
MSAENVVIWRFGLDVPDRCVHRLTALLAHDEHEHALRIRSDLGRRRWIAGRAQLRMILGLTLGKPAKQINLRCSAYGKPELAVIPERQAPFRFNLAHSEDIAVLATTPSATVGIDIEVPRPLMHLDRLAKHVLADSELECLSALPEVERNDRYFVYWTGKEAFAKAIGDGLGRSFKSIEVGYSWPEGSSLISVDGCRELARSWTLVSLAPFRDTIGAICVATREGVHIEYRNVQPADLVMLTGRGNGRNTTPESPYAWYYRHHT